MTLTVSQLNRIVDALRRADDLLHSAEIQGLARGARVRGFSADCQKVRRAREVADSIFRPSPSS